MGGDHALFVGRDDQNRNFAFGAVNFDRAFAVGRIVDQDAQSGR
jgi:hypothetical protein